jgi:hypothetical protein
MRDPLALTRDQVILIQTAAAVVPPRWRERFLAGVSDLLTTQPRPTNGDVRDVVGSVVRTMRLGRGIPVLADD